jgi:hypothetical protein
MQFAHPQATANMMDYESVFDPKAASLPGW